jgi:uncharacterized protein with HEPN domain
MKDNRIYLRQIVDYIDDIDLKIVWNTIKNDLLDLKKKLKEFLEK